MKISHHSLEEIRADINAALAAVAKKHDIKLSLGNISFTPSMFYVKLTGENLSADGVSEQSIVDVPQYLRESLGKMFVAVDGDEYKFVGWRSRARRFPVIAQAADGRTYSFPLRALDRLVRSS